jgi:hypothetical protein
MLLNNLDVMILKDFLKIITICFQNLKKKNRIRNHRQMVSPRITTVFHSPGHQMVVKNG